MKGMFWVTRSGDVVESDGPFAVVCKHRVAPCRRVGSNAYVGTRRLDKLRPATAAEVKAAKEKWGKR